MGNSGTNWFSWIKCQQLGQVDDVRPEKKKSDVNETSEGFTSGNFFNCSLIAQISLSRNPSKGYVWFAVAHHQLGFFIQLPWVMAQVKLWVESCPLVVSLNYWSTGKASNRLRLTGFFGGKERIWLQMFKQTLYMFHILKKVNLNFSKLVIFISVSFCLFSFFVLFCFFFHVIFNCFSFLSN